MKFILNAKDSKKLIQQSQDISEKCAEMVFNFLNSTKSEILLSQLNVIEFDSKIDLINEYINYNENESFESQFEEIENLGYFVLSEGNFQCIIESF